MMLLFNVVCLLVLGLFLGFPILSSALVFSVVYVWCQINKDVIVTFWFGVQVKVLLKPAAVPCDDLHASLVLIAPSGYVLPMGFLLFLLHPRCRVSLSL